MRIATSSPVGASALKIILALLALPVLLSCSRFRSVSKEECFISFQEHNNTPLQRVAILPFENATGNEELGSIVRKNFYEHFSSKNFHDLEICEVDHRLQEVEVALHMPWQEIPTKELGAFLNADYLIFGEVQEITETFWVFYSQGALAVDARMLETESGRVAWKKKVIHRSHCGDVPLGPFDIVKIFIRAKMNINDAGTLDLVDKTCLELVHNIPDPPAALVALQSVDIQLCSFREKTRALRIQKELCGKGFHPKIIPASVKQQNFYRVVIGPYTREEARKVEALLSEDSRFSPLIVEQKTSTT
jgi:hypothetical protein